MNEEIPVYIGSYSNAAGEGIYPFTFNSLTGELAPMCTPLKIANPSYLAFSRDFRFLYAVLEIPSSDENTGGRVAAYFVDAAGGLHFLNAQPTLGSDPCYLQVDNQNSVLVCANYTSGSMTVFPLAKNGKILPRSAVIAHTGSGPVVERQSGPHMHFTDFVCGEKYVCTVDLGIDAIKFYRYKKETRSISKREEITLALKPGSGPRHIVFHPQKRYVYVINELSSEIAVASYSEDYQLEIRQYISTLPPGCAVSNTAAAIRISNDGETLFASNRGGDCIAVFEVEKDGLLKWSGSYPSDGQGPRDFVVDPKDQFMLVANEKSNIVSVLKIDRSTKALTPTNHSAAIYRPSCIAFAH